MRRHDRLTWIVGHSRGGSMARILAVRRPDLVAGIVCLGSPLQDQFAIHPLVRAQVALVALLGSVGVPGPFSRGCLGGCCAQVLELSAPIERQDHRRAQVAPAQQALEPARDRGECVTQTGCRSIPSRAEVQVADHLLRIEDARGRRRGPA